MSIDIDRKFVITYIITMSGVDAFAKSHCRRHPGENRGPDVVPANTGSEFWTGAGNHEQILDTGFRRYDNKRRYDNNCENDNLRPNRTFLRVHQISFLGD